MKKYFICVMAIMACLIGAGSLRAQGLDQYGGSLDLQCANGATGHFYAQEIGNRWWLCDSLGNAFWETGVFNVGAPPVANSKFGNTYNWAARKTAQLKSWGFNTLDVDINEYLLPDASYSGWPGDHTQPNKMERTLFFDASNYPNHGTFNACPAANTEATKEFGFFDDPAYWSYSGFYSISINSPFAPCFVEWINTEMNPATTNTNTGVSTTVMNSPWLIGVEAGEGDYERGFGAGPLQQDGPSGALNTSQGFPTIEAGHNNDNLGVALLMSAPYATYSGANGFNYLYTLNRSNIAKQELANWLQGHGQVSFDAPASAASSAGVVTLTFSNTQPLPYAVGDAINVQACSDANFNGSNLSVLSATATAITYTEPISDTASTVNYCVVSLTSAPVMGATLATGVETVTMAVNPYKTGDIVTITGASPAAFNTAAGTGCGVTAYTATTFTCTNGAGGATYASGGAVTSGPGYTLALLNTAWGSNYTTWGTTATNYVDTISTSASPGACDRTTWRCAGTLSHVPDMFSVWIKDNGAAVAGEGNSTANAAFFGSGGAAYTAAQCTMTNLTDASGNVTVTCAQSTAGFTVGAAVSVYTHEEGGIFNGAAITLTGVTANTLSWTLGSSTFSIPTPCCNDDVQLTAQINVSNGAFDFMFPSGSTPGASDTITIDYYSGGFAHGTGFLDEAGQHSWVPSSDPESMVDASVTDAFRNDMNDFVYHFASVWFGTERQIIKNYWPNVMYLGTDEASGSWCTPARVPVLRAVGQYVDMASEGESICGDSSDQARLDYNEKYLGNVPLTNWTGITANADSSVSSIKESTTGPSAWEATTQAQRGAEYAAQISEYLNIKVSAGNGPASGQYPFVGIHLWDGGTDDPSQADWGLTTYPNDNPYDGKSAVQAVGTDQWGYPTGGESTNYGDSLTAISRANRLWLGLIPRTLVKTSGAP